jgi:hypothetical protein
LRIVITSIKLRLFLVLQEGNFFVRPEMRFVLLLLVVQLLVLLGLHLIAIVVLNTEAQVLGKVVVMMRSGF